MICLCVFTDEVRSCVSGHSGCIGCVIMMKLYDGSGRLCRFCNSIDFEIENGIISSIALSISKHVQKWMNDNPRKAGDLVDSDMFDSQIRRTNFLMRKGKFRCPVRVDCDKLPLQHLYHHLHECHSSKYIIRDFQTQDVYLPLLNCYDLAAIHPSEGPSDVGFKIRGLGLFAVHESWRRDEYVKKNYTLENACVKYLSGVDEAFQCTIYLQRPKIILKRTSICQYSDTDDTITNTLQQHMLISFQSVLYANAIKQNYEFRIRLLVVKYSGVKVVIPNELMENHVYYDELKP